MSRLIIWFLQKFPAPERRAIYREALGDLNHIRRREFLMRLIAEEYGYDCHIHKNPRRAVNPAVSGVDE